MARTGTLSFTEVAVTAQQDLFQVEALTTPIKILAIYLSQSNIVGDAAEEGLSILIRRATDAVTNDVAEALLDLGSSALLADLAINETTELVTGTEIIHSEVWNIRMPFMWLPTPEMQIVVPIGDAVVVNLNTTPAGSTTMSGTIYLSQEGS